MGGRGSGRHVEKFERDKNAERKALLHYSIKKDEYSAALLLGLGRVQLDKLKDKTPENVRKIILKRLVRYMEMYPDFQYKWDSAIVDMEIDSLSHWKQSSFPRTAEGKWQKGDPTLAKHFLENILGIGQKAPTSQELAQALAPLIQFGQKEPPRDASSATPEARTYFDAPKETEAS
jgi:hypothetical protein